MSSRAEPQEVVRFTSSVLTARERGEEFGSRFAAEVSLTVAAYDRLLSRRAGGTFDLDHWGERAAESIRRVAPDAAEEIAGIASGAGLPVSRVAAINARTELLAIADPSGLECSTVVADGPAGVVAVQTWDWYHAMSGGWLVWTIPGADGGRIETMTEYGVLAKVGVNDRGLGVLLNMLHHKSDDQSDRGRDAEIGYPVHVLLRSLLEHAGSLPEADALVRSVRMSASSAVTVVDRSGAACSYELFPGGVGELRPVRGLLVRTNHFVSPEGEPGCLADRIGENSWARRNALLDAFAGAPPESARQVVAAMCHHDTRGPVCVHPDPGHGEAAEATVATVVLDVTTARLDVTAGGPCARTHAGP